MVNTILATVLICAAATAPAACDRATAVDVVTEPVPSLFACMMAGQLIPAHHQLLSDGRYAKVRCGARPAP